MQAKNVYTNKLYCLIVLTVLSMGSAFANNKSYLMITFKDNKHMVVESFSKFKFKDDKQNVHQGRFMFLNDSVFYAVNSFNERAGAYMPINSIQEVYSGNQKFWGFRRISAVGAVAITMFIPGGFYFLVIREIFRKSEIKKRPGQNGWINKKDYSLKVYTNSVN